MGKIKKILENELVGGTQDTDVYPVTSVKAVYDEDNERLDHILNRRGVVNISTNYNADHIAEVLTLEQAITKVPSKDRVLGFQGKFLSENGWKSYVFIGDSIADWTNKTKWNNYLTGTDIVQWSGEAEDKVMSQKAVSDKLSGLADKSKELEDKKADAKQVNSSLYDLEKKIGERFVVEGNVTNLPDEEDLTSVKESERDVLKLADRSYSPYNFSGKGYKILRKNIKLVSLAVTEIVVSSVPTSDGYLTFIINGVESHVDVVASSDTTTDKVAEKIAEKLSATMIEYEVLKDASTITLNRKFGGEISTPSSFSAVNTSVSCTITDSTKKELRNILTPIMMNQPNTIYEIRYDFDLNGETIEMQEGCTLKFDGGCLSNGSLVGNNTSYEHKKEIVFYNIEIRGTWNVNEILSSVFDNLSVSSLNSLMCNSLEQNVYIQDNIIVKKNDSIKVKSNTKLNFCGNTVTKEKNNLTNYYIIEVENASNVVIENVSVIGDLLTHDFVEGSTSEWGFGIAVLSSNNVKLHNCNVKNCTGDGIYVGSSDNKSFGVNISITNCYLDNNRRNNISIITGKLIEIRNCFVKNAGKTNGTLPKKGIDVEANHDFEPIEVIIDSCTFEGNIKGDLDLLSIGEKGSSYLKAVIKNMNLSSLTSLQCFQNVVFENCTLETYIGSDCDNIKYNNCMVNYSNYAYDTGENGIEYNNCTIIRDNYNAGNGMIEFYPQSEISSYEYYKYTFNNCVFYYNGEPKYSQKLSQYYYMDSKHFVKYYNCKYIQNKNLFCNIDMWNNRISYQFNWNTDEEDNSLYRVISNMALDNILEVEVNIAFHDNPKLDKKYIYKKINDTFSSVVQYKKTDIDSSYFTIDNNIFAYLWEVGNKDLRLVLQNKDHIKASVSVNISFNNSIKNIFVEATDSNVPYPSAPRNFIKTRCTNYYIDNTLPSEYISVYEGYVYYDTEYKKHYRYHKDSQKWIDDYGVERGITLNGQFSLKPNPHDVPIGTIYYCTDKNANEEGSNGIVLFNNGSEWTDCLGRIVN